MLSYGLISRFVLVTNHSSNKCCRKCSIRLVCLSCIGTTSARRRLFKMISRTCNHGIPAEWRRRCHFVQEVIFKRAHSSCMILLTTFHEQSTRTPSFEFGADCQHMLLSSLIKWLWIWRSALQYWGMPAFSSLCLHENKPLGLILASTSGRYTAAYSGPPSLHTHASNIFTLWIKHKTVKWVTWR